VSLRYDAVDEQREPAAAALTRAARVARAR
jgi:hypothetical protein